MAEKGREWVREGVGHLESHVDLFLAFLRGVILLFVWTGR